MLMREMTESTSWSKSSQGGKAVLISNEAIWLDTFYLILFWLPKRTNMLLKPLIQSVCTNMSK